MTGLAAKIRSAAAPVAVFALTVLAGMAFLNLTAGRPEREAGALSAGPSGAPLPSSSLEEKDVAALVPANWKIVKLARKGRGWSQLGTIPLELPEALDEVTGLMAEAGCRPRLRVPEGEITDTVLVEFAGSSGGNAVLWSLWASGPGRTGYSWGMSK